MVNLVGIKRKGNDLNPKSGVGAGLATCGGSCPPTFGELLVFWATLPKGHRQTGPHSRESDRVLR